MVFERSLLIFALEQSIQNINLILCSIMFRLEQFKNNIGVKVIDGNKRLN